MQYCNKYSLCLEEFNKLLQNNFKIDVTAERQHLLDKINDIDTRKKLDKLLIKYTNPVTDGKDLEHAIILGCEESRFKKRFDFLIEQLESGAGIKFLYPAGGERDLWLDYEPITIEFVSQRLSKLKNITKEEAVAIVEEKKLEFFKDVFELDSKQQDSTCYRLYKPSSSD